MTPEAQARVNIDVLLIECGWAVQDSRAANLYAGRGVAVREFTLLRGHGTADYLLYIDQHAIGVIEAKPSGYPLIDVEPQTDKYVAGLPEDLPAWLRPLPFMYQSTGDEMRFTNGLDPEPRSRRVFAFHRPGTLAEWAGAGDVAAPPQEIAAETPAPYVARETTLARLRTMPPLDHAGLWPVQTVAIRNLERSLAQGRPRALIPDGHGQRENTHRLRLRLSLDQARGSAAGAVPGRPQQPGQANAPGVP